MITTEAGLLDALPGRRIPFVKTAASGLVTAGNLDSLWKQTTEPAAGATPPTGVGEVPTRATTGALDFVNNAAGGNTLYLARVGLTLSSATTFNSFLVVYDRLVHTSGLDGTLTTPQTVNSVAVTRPDGTGVGAEAWLEVYTLLGSTSRTVAVSYTNQAGVAGRAGTATIPSNLGVSSMVQIALQAGDTGVRSVETVTLSASTGTAGNFGVTLLRQLAMVNFSSPSGALNPYVDADWLDVALAPIDADACLALAHSSDSLGGSLVGQIAIIEG